LNHRAITAVGLEPANNAKQDLDEAGFKVYTSLHTDSQYTPYANIAKCDMCIFWPSLASKEGWMRVGIAMSHGMRLIIVDPEWVKNPPALSIVYQHAALVVPSWEDIKRNQFLKLGNATYKKG